MMKKLLFSAVLVITGTGAQASEHGCKVLLCLANPASNGGPRGVSECIPSINQLYHDLSRGRPFPNCDLADGNNGRSYARQVHDPYDVCPQGTQPATPGIFVVQGIRKSSPTNVFYSGINGNFSVVGQPAMSQQQVGERSNDQGPRACIGTQIGQYRYGDWDNGYDVLVFDRVTWQRPQSPAAIDVWIDGQFQQRVRY